MFGVLTVEHSHNLAARYTVATPFKASKLPHDLMNTTSVMYEAMS